MANNNDLPNHLAVLIDADNTPPAIVEGLFEEIAKYGTASVKRIYGDWTKPNLGGWKKVLLDHSIQPVQQFAYTTGKNATDSSLIIDAMDLLYTRDLDGFCLVSSDSDFTRLAARLREAGLTVYGFGEQKTPKPLVAACDKFIYTEILREDQNDADTGKAGKAAKERTAGNKPPIEFISRVIDDISGEDNFAHLGVLGQNLNKRRPEFDTRLYGFKKLSDLLAAQKKYFELRKGENGGLWVRNKSEQG